MFMKKKEKETVVVGNLNEIIVKRKEALLKYQQERVDNFIDECKSKFAERAYRVSSPFFDVVCDVAYNHLRDDPKRTFIIEDFDEILKTKERADIFFSFYTSYVIVWYDHHLSHWGGQTQDRIDRWKQLGDKIDEYCMKYYGCHWGEQKVTYEEEIPKYKPLIPITSTKDVKINMVNRPLYKGEKKIGYIKCIEHVSIIVGYHPEWDEVDGDYYPNVPDYEHYTNSILLYGKPKKVDGIRFYERDHKTYILGNSLDNYSVLEDRVVMQ